MIKTETTGAGVLAGVYAMMAKANAILGCAGFRFSDVVATTFRRCRPHPGGNAERAGRQYLQTIEVAMGPTYVNDFNLLGRTYRHGPSRCGPPVGGRHRNCASRRRRRHGALGLPCNLPPPRTDCVPREDFVPRWSCGNTAPDSSGYALEKMAQIAERTLPMAWISNGRNSAFASERGRYGDVDFPLCVVFVFLFLAAQYESWSLPIAVILIVPMCLMSSIPASWSRHGQQYIDTVGLSYRRSRL